MDQKFCQSCGMPLTEDVLGTNADGSKNEDYCMYCYVSISDVTPCKINDDCLHCCPSVRQQFTVLA